MSWSRNERDISSHSMLNFMMAGQKGDRTIRVRPQGEVKAPGCR